MICWIWAVIAFFAGALFGMFILALAEISRGHDSEGWPDK